jgi:hypothetical protein
MPSTQRTPKTLSEWIELDYFRRPRPLRGFRKWLLWAFVLKAALVLAITLRPRSHVIYQAGPVSSAHAMFNNDCGQCHTELFQPVRRLWPGDVTPRSVTDQTCLRCHDGPIHHEQQVASPSCATCHQEHRGRARLAEVADSHCTACHADLRRKDGSACEVLNVRGFALDHPEFALWRSEQPRDPSTLRFNHHVHLRAEGVRGAQGQPVKLDCASCHQPDPERRYMRPVTYERHCAECHPLTVPLPGEWKDARAREAAAEFRHEPAPHEPPAVVRAVLRDRLTEFFQLYPVEPHRRGSPEPARPFPGRPAPAPVLVPATSWVSHQLAAAQRLLFEGASGCRYCHTGDARKEPNRLPEYARTNIPERWLPRSLFHHDSHRLLDCCACHGDVTASKKSDDVLLPRVDSCRQCHNPQVGVRANCVDCHRYHNHGQGQDWTGKRTIAECLGQQ